MRKLTIYVLIAALLAALLLCGCKKPDDIIIDVDPINTENSLPTGTQPGEQSTPTEPGGTALPTDAVSAEPTEPSAPTAPGETDAAGTPGEGPTAVPFVSDTPAVTGQNATPTPYAPPTSGADPTSPPVTGITVPTIAPTAAPTTPPGQPDYSVFDNCCFIGNSVFEGLHNYGVIKNGTWYTKVGLNILTVYNTPVLGGTVPIIDELNHGSYTGVLLMFCQNECGWPNLNNFIVKYEQLLQDVWARQPQAKLFLMGITPVSQAVSDKGENGVTNANINTINSGLEALAARTQNAYYVSVPSSFYTANGALQNDASNDGVHLNKAYMEVWADHICGVVDGVL